MLKLAPSILAADFSKLAEEVQCVEQLGADYIHIDVMDGHFVPNITLGPGLIKCLRPHTSLPFDVHLMIENPEKYIDDFIKAGADIITFHYEAITPDNISDLIYKIKEKDVKAGLSIKPKTSPEDILKYLPELDMLLVMTVEPGFGGQKFMQDCAEKIKTIKKHAPENLIIQVDGGINNETAKICTQYGATSLVAGNYIYKSDDIKQAILSLKN